MADASSGLVLKKRGDVVTRQIVGETLLVPIRGRVADMQKLFCLNPVAAFVWEKLDGTRTLADIRDAVLDAFAVQQDRAEADIQEFIAELLAAELVQEAS
ncbi:MAG: PqqD family protein [Planctomycetes bacterium]|nr:PqqD family protein [Planctomycetota bacterium]